MAVPRVLAYAEQKDLCGMLALARVISLFEPRHVRGDDDLQNDISLAIQSSDDLLKVRSGW